MSFGVHFLNKWTTRESTRNFGTLLMMISCVPTITTANGIAQQTAAALAEDRERQLAGMIQRAWMWTFILWVIAVVVMTLIRGQIGSKTGTCPARRPCS